LCGHRDLLLGAFLARWWLSLVPVLSNKRLKLAARVDYGMNSSSARRSLSAVR
jgi:hypothetical protein